MIWWILSRTTLRYCAAATELLFAFVFLFVVVAFYGEVIPVGNMEKDGDVYFYVRSNGIHTDVCLPASNDITNWYTFIPTKDFGSEVPTEFISLGWGDKGFFMNTPKWEDLTIGTAFSAIALPTPTAMHVAYEPEPVESANCVKIYVSKQQYKRMVRFIKGSFTGNGTKAELIRGKGYTEKDNFYEAHRSYHLFRTCNTWTNLALKAAEVRTGMLAVFPNSVMGHLRQ